jgi:UDP-N-acetylmuramyl pentapeptide phosphotransferase/UDP-N-acetylglucosamine-1-phosphate transferase
MTAALGAAVAGMFAWALTWAYVRAMHAWARLEPPSARGMHAVAKPTGAGAVFIPVALGAWAINHSGDLGRVHLSLIAASLFLVAVSWADDQRGGLPPLVRIACHTAVIATLLFQLDDGARIAPWLPLLLERIALAIAWLWFINLFNFMDGIDGLAGSETIVIALGYWLVALSIALSGPLPHLGLILAAAAAGYLGWNWNPSRVMMGDAGSIPLGFLLGWLLIDLAMRGHWAAALILPLYFAADATITLIVRLLRGDKPWQPHREHFYQRAVLAGLTPAQAVARISIANACLLMLALLSVVYPLLALAGAVLVVTVLLLHLRQTAQRNLQKSVQK